MTVTAETSHPVFADCSPIFIVGSGRSGTTLLQMMINAHPRMAIAGELHFFDQILQLRRHVPDLGEPDRIDRLFALLDNTYGSQFLTEMEEVFPAARDRLKSDPQPNYEKLYLYLMEGYARIRGAERFGEKTPENVRYLDRLVAFFPNCRILHMIRDPRANVASRLKVPWTSDDVVTNALKWRLDVLSGLQFMRRRGNGGLCKEILYEKLVADPAAELRDICRFVGVEFDPRMLAYHGSAGRFIRNEPWKEGTLRPAFRSSVESWCSELSPSQVFLIERIAAPLMRHYGYPRAQIGLGAKVASPLVFCRELTRWGRYKVREQRDRRNEAPLIYGEKTKLYRMLFRQFLTRGD